MSNLEVKNDITWFRDLLATSLKTEANDPGQVMNWLYSRRSEVSFQSELIGLDEVRNWLREPDTGNIIHESGAFFSIEGVRTTARGLREVASWDQPIYNQKEGGILALLCARDGNEVHFLLNGKAEPGNLGVLQLAPSIQCTWSNLRQAHRGKRPPLVEIILGEVPSRLVYRALHHEEGGRFWQKSNANQIHLLDSKDVLSDLSQEHFVWASLSQIKHLALIDNVLSPFVKTIISPL